MKHYYKTALLQYWALILWLVATEERLAVAGAGGSSTTTTPSAGQLPLWVRSRDRRLLGMAVAGMAADAVVAADGTGQYTTIKQALEAAQADTNGRRYMIHVKAGKYLENVEIWRPNITMIGDGMGRTIISGKNSKTTNRGTACTGTLNVQRDSFIARDLTVENTAGPEAMQAAAVVVKSDRAVFFRCEITGYQDTLLADCYRQFYRECVISGTVDFVWGEATAVFQRCLLLARRPLEGGHNVVTAQGRHLDTSVSAIASSGFVFQACNVSTQEDLRGVDTYLGRPWHPNSRVVFMSSYLDGNVVNPKGWVAWNSTSENSTASTVYYGEYNNTGDGAIVSQRVHWDGFHLLTADEVRDNFTVDIFIDGALWLPETNVSYHLDLGL